MKLLSYTSRTQLVLFLVLFGVFAAVFYLVMRWNVYRNVDEVLYNRKMNLLAYLQQHPRAPYAGDNPLDDFTFYKIGEPAFRNGKEAYSNTLIYEPVDDELDEYRKLVSYVKLHGNFYRLEIIKPHLEANEIITTVAITLGGLFVGLTLCYYVSQRIISQKIWKPFYELLERLRRYRMDKATEPELPASRIDEFKALNEAVAELSSKNKEIFESQKQFTENASHEMQTPLSVIQSRLEALIERPELTGKQAEIIEGIISSTQRLKKLNKTLLLLSRIENKQFPLTDQVAVKETIDRMLVHFEEQKEKLNLTVQIQNASDLTVKGNTLLTEMLIQNLLKNAFVHNTDNGKVLISLDAGCLTIANTGQADKLDNGKIFDRFYKRSGHAETWGLGLSIARKVSETSGWSLHYTHQAGQHIFSLYF